jgi:hypothetical protein
VKKCNVRMAEGHVVRCEIGGSPGRNRGKPKRHACTVAGEETTALSEAQPRNSSGSLTS